MTLGETLSDTRFFTREAEASGYSRAIPQSIPKDLSTILWFAQILKK